MHIGFLYPYHEYHVYHSAPTAFELSRLDPNLKVLLLSSSQHNSVLLRQLSGHYPGNRCTIKDLSQPWSFRYLNVNQRRFPSAGLMVKRHTFLLKGMDVIVGTNHAIAATLRNAGITSPKLIMAFHGSGDRAYGFSRRLRRFDLLLLSGTKKYRRLKAAGILRKDNWAIVGYPKFDVIRSEEEERSQLFPEHRPIVLYNPHFRKHLSSWYEWGRKILDFFVSCSRYNLIFAPHVEIKGRKQKWLTLRKYRSYPHIHVDLGSRESIDLTYTKLANIYLGDVSSQIGEFLLHPRPSVFLNSHHISWKADSNYSHWLLGPVIDSLSQLEDALVEAQETHDFYLPEQVQYFKDSFELTEEPSGLRAAREIHSFLMKNFPLE